MYSLKGPRPAQYRRINLINSPKSIWAGTYVADSSYGFDIGPCPYDRMSPGTYNCLDVPWIGINELQQVSELKIYPNPNNSDYLHIDYTVDKPCSATIEVLDFMGRSLSTKKVAHSIDENEIELDITTLTVGYYLIKLTVGESNYVVKFIRQ